MLHISDIESWEALSEADKMTYLRGFIKARHIKGVTTDELVEFLVLLVNTPFTDKPREKEEVERYTSLVKQLLQVRLTESLHRRSMIAAGLALVLSVLSLYLAWHKDDHSANSATVSAQTLSTTNRPTP